jgi:hypothetical protein
MAKIRIENDSESNHKIFSCGITTFKRVHRASAAQWDSEGLD